MNRNTLIHNKKKLRKRAYYGLVGLCLLIILIFLVSLQLADFKALSGDEFKTLKSFNSKIASCETQSSPQPNLFHKSKVVSNSSNTTPIELEPPNLEVNWLRYNSYLYKQMLEYSCLPDGLDTRFLGKWNLWISITGLFALGCIMRLILRNWLSALIIICISIATIFFKSEIGLISPFHSTQSMAFATLFFLLFYQISGSIFVLMIYHFSLTVLFLFDASFVSWLVLLPLATILDKSVPIFEQNSESDFVDKSTSSQKFSLFDFLKKLEKKIQAHPIFLKKPIHLQRRLINKKSSILNILSLIVQLVLFTYLSFFRISSESIVEVAQKSLSFELISHFLENWLSSWVHSSSYFSIAIWIFIFCLHIVLFLVPLKNDVRLMSFVKMLLFGFWLHFFCRICLDYYNFQIPNFLPSSYRQTTNLLEPLILITIAACVYNLIERRFFPRFRKARVRNFV